MTDLDTIAPRLDWFAGLMRAKLGQPENVAKSDWREMSPEALFRLLEAEVDELRAALAFDTPDMVMLKAADVGNLAMMLADLGLSVGGVGSVSRRYSGAMKTRRRDNRDWDAQVEGRPTPGCDTCGHLACVCVIRERHDKDCKFRIAAAGPVGIACDHGRDCCPICDPCTCGAGVATSDFGPPAGAR